MEAKAQSEINVCHEDQLKINLFARKNSHLCDLNEQIEKKQKELQNLKDASDDLMLVDDDIIPFEVGEVFIGMTEPQAQEALEEAKVTLEKELATLREGCDEAQKILTDLKVQLYAKFGDNINLEAD